MAGQSNILRTLTAAIVVIGISSGCAATRSVATLPVVSLLPVRNDARAESIRQWNDWADDHLQNGDIVFMRGDCYIMMGTVNFSEISTDLTDSRFSHIGLVGIDNGQAYVYDIRNEGCLKTRFGELLAHRQLHQIAIKRHREATPAKLVTTVAYCRAIYNTHPKYDDQLKLDNDRLYCTELVQEAYRRAGIRLSEPVVIQDLPNYGRHIRTLQFVRAVKSIELDQPVLLPGNEQFGVWSNPDLELILDLPDTKVPPPS
jgi:hypothetical protein